MLATLAALREEVRRLHAAQDECLRGLAEVSAAVETSAAPCSACGGRMLVQKTLHRRVVTLAHGSVRASETVRTCAAGCNLPAGARMTRRSDELRGLVPPGAVYGYDIEVRVGLERFVHHRQREEIRTELRRHGIVLSTGAISALATRFTTHLQALHQASAERIRAALEKDGGYPLHVDATGEDGRGTLFVAYAGWRRWVLGAWKMPTEPRVAPARSARPSPRLRERRGDGAAPAGRPARLRRPARRGARPGARGERGRHDGAGPSADAGTGARLPSALPA